MGTSTKVVSSNVLSTCRTYIDWHSPWRRGEARLERGEGRGETGEGRRETGGEGRGAEGRGTAGPSNYLICRYLVLKFDM